MLLQMFCCFAETLFARAHRFLYSDPVLESFLELLLGILSHPNSKLVSIQFPIYFTQEGLSLQILHPVTNTSSHPDSKLVSIEFPIYFCQEITIKMLGCFLGIVIMTLFRSLFSDWGFPRRRIPVLG